MLAVSITSKEFDHFWKMLRNLAEDWTPRVAPLAFSNEKLSNLPLSGWFFRPLLDLVHLI